MREASTTVSSLPSQVFDCLREMDREAVGNIRGWPVGLRWYCAYERTLHPARTKRHNDYEDSWTRRLGELLVIRHALKTRLFERYPGGRSIGDLVVELPSSERIWLEIKGAWSYINCKESRLGFYKDAYQKYLYGRPGKSIESDFKKLVALKRPFATHCGVLLIGFDMESPVEYAIAESELLELRRRCGLMDPVWSELYDSWPESNPAINPRKGEGFRCRTWLWIRSCASVESSQ